MGRCVEEGVLLWVRGGEDVWRKVRCGGGVRMGVEGRTCVGAGTKVRCLGCAGAKMCGGRCAAVGACVWVWKGARA